MIIYENCPFCQEQPAHGYINNDVRDQVQGYWYVECQNHKDEQGHFNMFVACNADTEEEAAQIWNTRHKTLAEEICDDIEGYLSGYLASMYPDDWKKLSNSCKRSIKGAIINAWHSHTRQLEKYPWLPIKAYKKPRFKSYKHQNESIIRWHIKANAPIIVTWASLDKCWYTAGMPTEIAEEEMLPYFAYMPKKPQL